MHEVPGSAPTEPVSSTDLDFKSRVQTRLFLPGAAAPRVSRNGCLDFVIRRRHTRDEAHSPALPLKALPARGGGQLPILPASRRKKRPAARPCCFQIVTF
jgi:hypothetical protein